MSKEDELRNDPSIPSVGQEPYKVVLWYPTAVIVCRCQGPGKLALVIVTGIQNTASCGVCNKHYTIAQVGPEMGPNGNAEVIVDVYIPPPEGTLM